jgi:hypothetical protein
MRLASLPPFLNEPYREAMERPLANARADLRCEDLLPFLPAQSIAQKLL